MLISPVAICCPLLQPIKPVKLSWPREGDRRRARVAKSPPREAISKIAPIYSTRMIHVTDRDMAKHYDLSDSLTMSESSLVKYKGL